MDGIYSPKTTSRTFPTDWALKWWEALLLFGGGALAVVLHRAFDMSLGLPGHHGMEWMAMIGGLVGALIMLGIQRSTKNLHKEESV